MSKAYKIGYEKGYTDAKAGKGKSYRGIGRGLLTLNFNQYANEYAKGYDKGYETGLKDK